MDTTGSSERESGEPFRHPVDTRLAVMVLDLFRVSKDLDRMQDEIQKLRAELNREKS